MSVDGELNSPSQRPPKPCLLQVVDFDFETKVEKNIELSEVNEAIAAGRFIWIDLEAGNLPEARHLLGELNIVADEIVQDALTAEAATRHARFDNCIHVVVSGCQQRGLHFDLERVDIVISQSFLITIHKGPVSFLQAVRRDYKQDFQRFAKSPSFLVYELCDRLIDNYLAIQQ